MRVCTRMWQWLDDDDFTTVELLTYMRLGSAVSSSADHGPGFDWEFAIAHGDRPERVIRRTLNRIAEKTGALRITDDRLEFCVLERNSKWLTCGVPDCMGSVPMIQIHPVGIAEGGNPNVRQPIPARLRAEVIERDGRVCGICGGSIEGKLHIDHIYPVARGGKTILENLQPAHPRCNMSKGSKVLTLEEA